MLFNYVFVQLYFHICGNIKTIEIGRVTSQSEVENKMAPNRLAAMFFTIMNDFQGEERLGRLLRPEEEKFTSSLHKAMRPLLSSCHHSVRHNDFVQSRTVITSKNPLDVVFKVQGL